MTRKSQAGRHCEKNSREDLRVGGTPKSGGVRFKIVGVVKSIKDRSKDKKVADGEVSFGNSKVTADLGLGSFSQVVRI